MPFRLEYCSGSYGTRLHALRMRIFARADQKCEECRVPDHRAVKRGPLNSWSYGPNWYSPDGTPPGAWKKLKGRKARKVRDVLIVLALYHLNCISADFREENLKALCQRCYRNYRKLHPEETRRELAAAVNA